MSGTTRKLKLTDLVAISSGQVIGAGVITLIGTAIGVAGMSAWLAYGASHLCRIFKYLTVYLYQ